MHRCVVGVTVKLWQQAIEVSVLRFGDGVNYWRSDHGLGCGEQVVHTSDYHMGY